MPLQLPTVQAISKDMGGFVMTLAEKLRNEGEIKGEIKGVSWEKITIHDFLLKS